MSAVESPVHRAGASIAKYALIVERVGGPLRVIASALREVDFLALQVEDGSVALEAIHAMPKLSLIVASEAALGQDAASWVTRVKAAHPEIPMLFCPTSGQRLAFGRAKPDAIITEPSQQTISSTAGVLLRQNLYPAAIVDGLLTSVARAAHTYGMQPLLGTPFLKPSRVLLLPISAVVSLSAESGSVGSMLVSATAAAARVGYRTIADSDAEPQGALLEDVVGEMCSMAAGQMKACYAEAGVPLQSVGVPQYIVGERVSFRRNTPAPSLAVGMGIELPNKQVMHEAFFMELYLDRVLEPLLGRDEVLEVLGAGQITFL